MSRILIVGPAWIGDMVMAQSLFMTLQRLKPDAIIDVLAPAWCLPLLKRMPQVRRAILAPFAHGQAGFAARWQLGRSLKGEAYDRAILLPNSWKSALVPFAAAIGQRTGWRGEMRYGLVNDLRLLDKPALPLILDRFNALAFAPGVITSAADFPAPHPYPALAIDPANVSATLEKFGLSQELPIVALCPGAEFGPAKRWPADKFAEIAAAYAKRGWQTWLFGSKADSEAAAAILDQLDDDARAECHDLTGRTSIDEAIDLMSCANLAVANDSGLMHVAASLGRPLVAIYGSTTPAHSPPLSENARPLWLGLDCSPCFKRVCPLGHTNCLNQLPARMVLDALDEVEQ